MNNTVKTILAFLFSVVLLYFGFKYFLTPAERELFFSVPLSAIIPSLLFAIPVYLAGGIELRYLYTKLGKVQLSAYDTTTLPFVINLWGFILPFQGSLIYTVTYLYTKYKRTVADSFKVYLISFAISMSIAGLIGLLFGYLSELRFPILFLVFCALLFLNPVVLYWINDYFKTQSGKNSWTYKMITKRFGAGALSAEVGGEMIFILLLIKIANLLLTGLWLYWVTIALKIDLNLIQLILIVLLMNITTLIKLTPGNIGINQFAAGGIAVLVGGTMNDGFLLSSFQYLTNIILATLIGGTFTFYNFKFLNWQKFKAALAEKRS